MDNLSPLELHALKILGRPADKARDRLAEGNGQAVDFVVRIRGAVNVGLTTESDTVEKPELATLLAVVLESLSPRVKSKLLPAVRERLNAFVAGGDPPQPAKAAADELQDLVAACSRPAKQTKRGNVTGSLNAERLEGTYSQEDLISWL